MNNCTKFELHMTSECKVICNSHINSRRDRQPAASNSQTACFLFLRSSFSGSSFSGSSFSGSLFYGSSFSGSSFSGSSFSGSSFSGSSFSGSSFFKQPLEP